MEEAHDNPCFILDEPSLGEINTASKPRNANGDIDNSYPYNGSVNCTESHSQPKAENSTKVLSNERPLPVFSRGRKLLYRRRGVILALGGAVFFSAENMFMDVLADSLNIFQIGSVMSLVVIACTFTFIVITSIDFPKTNWQYISLVISGLFLASGLPLALESLKFIEVGDSITIIYTMPLFSGIFSWIILREPLRIIDCLFAVLSFGGVVLIARPPFLFGTDGDKLVGHNPLLGAVYALASAASFSLLVVTARKQSIMGIHPVTILFFNAIVVLVTNAIVCTILSEWAFPNPAEWGFLLGFGFSDFLAQTFIYMAVVVEVAMFVSIISTFEVILTFLWQFLFLHIAPDWISVVGAALILASCVGLATKKDPPTGDDNNNEQQSSGSADNHAPLPSISASVSASTSL